jgi:general secretion pathway protein D
VITAHKAGNALVITSSSHDYAALRATIDRLDVERRQVFIEAVIMEMSVSRSSNLGIGMHGGVPNFPANGSTMVLGSSAADSLGGIQGLATNADALSGLALGVQGPDIPNSQELIGISLPSFGVALTALASSGDANVLSTPHLLAMDNVEAEINVGQNVPLQTSVAGGNLGGLGGLLGGAQGQNAQGAQQPNIGAIAGLLGGGGLEEISEAGEPSQQGNVGVRSIQRTRAKTQLVVRDQQTVVIGGLMRDAVTNGESKGRDSYKEATDKVFANVNIDQMEAEWVQFVLGLEKFLPKDAAKKDEAPDKDAQKKR